MIRGYSAIVLDENSRSKSRTWLIHSFKDVIPVGWEVVAHHMTIDPFKTDVDERLGQIVTLTTFEIGISDKAIAVKVLGYDRKTNNAFPHITLAINKANGGKAKDSNVIQSWIPTKNIVVFGTIQNVVT